MNRALKGKLIDVFNGVALNPSYVVAACVLLAAFMMENRYSATIYDIDIQGTYASGTPPVADAVQHDKSFQQLQSEHERYLKLRFEMNQAEAAYDVYSANHSSNTNKSKNIRKAYDDYQALEGAVDKLRAEIVDEFLPSPYLSEEELAKNLPALTEMNIAYRDECMNRNGNAATAASITSCAQEKLDSATKQAEKTEAIRQFALELLILFVTAGAIQLTVRSPLKAYAANLKDNFNTETQAIHTARQHKQEALKAAEVQSIVEGGIAKEIVVKKRMQLRAPNRGNP